MDQLQGKVALITGASRGIGRAIAVGFARRGIAVVLAAKTLKHHPKLPGSLEEVKDEIEKFGGKVIISRCDVREEEDILQTIQKGMETFGRIDILVNNAGALWWQNVADTPTKRLDLVLKVNIRAAFIFCREVLPSMIKNGWGHIINISPPIDLKALPGFTGYFISKYGMTMLTLGLAEEVRGKNIAVNSLWPITAIDTAAVRNYKVGQPQDWRKPSIMADAAIELISREPSTITGQILSDEEVLEWAGIQDLSQYSVIPGTDPPPIRWSSETIRS